MLSRIAKGEINMSINVNIGTFSNSTLNTKQAKSMQLHSKMLPNILSAYCSKFEGNSKETTNIFAKLFFNSYLFKLAIHEETFSNQKQIKHVVIACDKMHCMKKTKENMPTPAMLPK